MFSETFAAVMSAGLLACLVTTGGILLVSRRAEWAKAHSVHFISFAAGMLITVSIMHIVPKAMDQNAWAPALILVGFLGLYLLNHAMEVFLCAGENQRAPLGLIPMLGIGLHSFIDGWI